MPQSARLQDPNGFLLVKGCPISSYGVFQYSAGQVGLNDGDPNRIVNVFRPETAVNDPNLISSLQNVPLINDHEMLSGFPGDETATAPEEYGIDGVLFDVAYASPWLRGDVKVFTRKMQNDLASGKADLSLGYTCDFVLQSGEYDGTPYEVVQTNMRGNHIALVEAGRVPGARILDHKRLCFDHLDVTTSSTPKERPMAKKVYDSDVVANLRAQLKALLPAFEQFLNEEAAEPAHADPAAAAAGAPAAATTQPTQEAAVDPNAVADPATAAATPAIAAPAPAAAAAVDPNALLAQLQAICEQLKAMIGGGSGDPAGGSGSEDPGPTDPSNSETDADPSTTNPEGAQMPEAVQNADAVQGLAEDPNSHKLNVDSEEQGTASPGPAAGKHTGADAAMRAVYSDIAHKTRLYDRLSKVVGAFDGAMDIATATAADVAAYGVKKLNLKAPKGQEAVALDAYLSGVEAARRSAPAAAAKAAADAAAPVPAIDAYFKE